MRIAICDDIRMQAEELARLVTRYYGKSADVRIYDGGNALINAFLCDKSLAFDLIFLDILMPKYNGMAVAKYIRLSDNDVPIIFVTSTPDYSIQGYRVDAAAYITKPIDVEELKYALDKLAKQKARVENEQLAITTGASISSVPFAEIRSIEKYGRKTVITRIGKSPIHTNQPISEIVEQLNQRTQFAIFSQSNYINLTNALEFDKKMRIIKMCDGSEIIVARDRMKTLLDRFLMKYKDRA